MGFFFQKTIMKQSTNLYVNRSFILVVWVLHMYVERGVFVVVTRIIGFVYSRAGVRKPLIRQGN